MRQSMCRSRRPGPRIQLLGSNDGTTWPVLYSTTGRGTNGETITSSNLTAGNFQQHRVPVVRQWRRPRSSWRSLRQTVLNTGANEQ
jgi:hypothetical protein